MKTLILNGSPKKSGTIASMLKLFAGVQENAGDIEWIDLYDLSMKPCLGCMKCRQTEHCVLPFDDAHKVGQKINDADRLIIGTPTYWGNMSAQLKMLLERNVPVFMGQNKKGLPAPRQKGKKAAIVTACTTPYPFNFILPESRGAVNSVRHILRYGGYEIKGVLTEHGVKKSAAISTNTKRKAARMGARLMAAAE